MQKLLDVVYRYSYRWRFTFNIAKCNIVAVLGKRARVLQGSYYLGLEEMKVVNSYKYLGLEFEIDLKWNLAKQRLLAKAQGRLALLRKAKSEGLSLKAAENVWWAMVVPVLNFGAEIWERRRLMKLNSYSCRQGKRCLGSVVKQPMRQFAVSLDGGQCDRREI